MLYCAKCQVLSRDGDRCPLCGGKKLREAQADDPVLLLTTSGAESQRIAAAFDDAGIPHMENSLDTGSASSVILGQNRCLQARIFVPFGKIENAREVLHGIGVLKDDEKSSAPQEEQSLQDEEANQKEEIPMSHGRRLAVRIFSLLAFIALIWAVVVAADSIVNCFKSAFHLFK